MTRSTDDFVDELSIETATTIEKLDSLRGDYACLEVAAANTSPFAMYEWHRAWCAHFLNLDPLVRDELRIYVLRNKQSDCVAIVPLVASRRRFGPLQIVSLDLLGADPSTTEARTPLIVAGYEDATARAVRAQLELWSRWDWITWSGVAENFGRAIAAATQVEMVPNAPGYVLDLKSSWEEFRGGLKRNIRESLRHGYNSLKREGHSFTFEVIESVAAVRLGIARFLELHAMRARMPGSVEHPDHFASEVSRRFLSSVCECLAERGVVRIFQLRIGDAVVAVRIGFVVADCLNLYYSGFDPAWARYGVMTTALAESFKYAIGQKLKTVNLSRGADTSKTRWGPRTVGYVGGQELGPRLVSQLAHHFYSSARSGTGLPSWLLRRLAGNRRVWNS